MTGLRKGNKMKETLVALIKSKMQFNSQELQNLGIEIGKLYTNLGLPPDMALAKLNLPKEQTISVIDGIGQWLIEHKRNSGATDKAIERQRASNRKMVDAFLKNSELGVY